MKKKLFIILILILYIVFISCIHSEEIVITFPDNANWEFKYKDSLNNYVGNGKAVFEYYEKSKKFNLTFIEEAFGDEAKFKGKVIEQNNYIEFDAEGIWFLGEEFLFVGNFNITFDKIIDGSIAYSKELQGHINDILNDYYNYRKEIINYENVSDEEKNNIEKPKLPIYEEYLDKIYICTASIKE